jgi:hypothetical protein
MVAMATTDRRTYSACRAAAAAAKQLKDVITRRILQCIYVVTVCASPLRLLPCSLLTYLRKINGFFSRALGHKISSVVMWSTVGGARSPTSTLSERRVFLHDACEVLLLCMQQQSTWWRPYYFVVVFLNFTSLCVVGGPEIVTFFALNFCCLVQLTIRLRVHAIRIRAIRISCPLIAPVFVFL